MSGHRGSQLKDVHCGKCQVPLRGAGTGRKLVRYRCPVSGEIFTHPQHGRVLDTPHLVRFVDAPDARNLSEEYRAEHYPRWRSLDGTVLAAGTVTTWPAKPSRWKPLELVPLPADNAGDPARQVTNEPLSFSKCKGCGQHVASDLPRPDREWTPARESFTGTGRRYRQVIAVNTGPHPAGTPACVDCRPVPQPALN